MIEIKVNDRVRYSRAVLMAIQADYEIANMKGIVKAIIDHANCPQVIKVQWDGESEIKGALRKNLTILDGSIALEDCEDRF